MAENPTPQAFFDLWKKQIEEGTQAWSRLMGQGRAADPMAFWRPYMEQGLAVWSKLFTQGAITPEMMTQWKQFLDQWITTWSKALEQAMGTEVFAQALGKLLDQWLVAQAPLKKVTDESADATLSTLGIPSRSQMVGIARQLTDLDNRIERLEDRLAALMTRMDDLFKALGDHEEAAARRAAKKVSPRGSR